MCRVRSAGSCVRPYRSIWVTQLHTSKFMPESYFVVRHGQSHGPFPTHRLKQLAGDRKLRRDDIVIEQSTRKSRQAGQIPQLFSHASRPSVDKRKSREKPRQQIVSPPPIIPQAAKPLRSVTTRTKEMRDGKTAYRVEASDSKATLVITKGRKSERVELDDFEYARSEFGEPILVYLIRATLLGFFVVGTGFVGTVLVFLCGIRTWRLTDSVTLVGNSGSPPNVRLIQFTNKQSVRDFCRLLANTNVRIHSPLANAGQSNQDSPPTFLRQLAEHEKLASNQ